MLLKRKLQKSTGLVFILPTEKYNEAPNAILKKSRDKSKKCGIEKDIDIHQ